MAHFLVGSWQHHKSENLEGFYKQKWPRLPVSFKMYKRRHRLRINELASFLKEKSNLVLTIENEGKRWKIKSTYDPMLARSVELSFPFTSKIDCYEDREFEEGLFPNISMSVLTRESNKKLVQVNRTVSSDSKVLTTTYEIVGQQLIMKLEFEGATAVRYFNKFEP